MLFLLVAVVGATALGLGLASRLLREAPVTETLAALVVGIVIGPEVLGLVGTDGITVEMIATVALFVLAASVMSAALRQPTSQVRALAGPVALLLVVGLPVMALTSAMLAALIVGIPLASAMVLGAVLAPTDPVLTSNAVTGDAAEAQIPSRVRAMVSIESGSNDGVAAGIVMISTAAALGTGVGREGLVVALTFAASVVLGGMAGWLTGRLVVASERHHDIEHTAFLVLSLSLVAVVLGVSEVLGGESVLAVFSAALAYAHTLPKQDRREEWEVQEAVNGYLVLPVFTLLGIVLPWSEWAELGWGAPALVLAVTVLRRLPIVAALQRPLGVGPAEAGFVGWTGAVGVGSLYLAGKAVAHEDLDDRVWAVTTLVVAAAVVTHGISAAAVRRSTARHLVAGER